MFGRVPSCALFCNIFISLNNDTPESHVSFYLTLSILLRPPLLISTETSLLFVGVSEVRPISEHDKICFIRAIIVPSIMLHLA